MDHRSWWTRESGADRSCNLGFFARYLKDAAPGEVTFTAARAPNPADLLCTPTGQVATSIGGETVYSINRERAARILTAKKTVASRADLEAARDAAKIRRPHADRGCRGARLQTPGCKC